MKNLLNTIGILIGMYLVLFFTSNLFGQSNAQDSIVKDRIIPLSEITFKYDQLQNSLEEVVSEARIPKSIVKIDSNYNKFSSKVDSLGNDILQDTSHLNNSRIKYLQKEWLTYAERLKEWQIEIAEHNRKVEVLKDSLGLKLNLWNNSLEAAKEKEAPEEIRLRIQSAVDSTEKIKNELAKIDQWLILAQDKLISAQARVNEISDFLDAKARDYRGSLFVVDSEPFWRWGKSAVDHDYWKELGTSYADQQRVLFLFFDDYSWQFVFHFLIFIAFIWFFNFLKRKYTGIDLPGDDYRIQLAKTTLAYANTSAIILSFMISIYYYKSAPEVVFSILTILVSIPVIILFPKYVNIASRKFLYLVIVVYLLQEIQQLIITDHLLNRVSQLLKAGIIIYVLSSALKNQGLKKEGFGNRYWSFIIRYLGPVFLFLSVASIVANLTGAYQLSEVLISGVISASTYAIIFMIYGILIASVFIVVLRSKYATSIQKFTKDNAKFELRISGLIHLYMLFLWLKSTLLGFQLLDPIVMLYEDFIALFWEIGGVKISVGGIMSFLVILAVTFLLSKLIREIINDNVIPVKESGRGLPNAFSMVIRYMIVSLGVYVALSAAGINLTEFGLVAGALGVGLGFGLQNILHNLVSGLIVSFERPVHVGDTVEVDKLQGVVTEIGVRSSKIRTFDGSEVILPNGNLLSNQVINWTLTDQKRRLEIKVGTSYDANPREVIELLKKEVISHKNVLTTPNPMCLFEGYGDSALHFRVLFWVQYNVGLSTKSDVALSIYDRLKEKQIEAPIPQQRLLYQDGSKTQERPM